MSIPGPATACGFAHIDFTPLVLAPPRLISPESVRGAGVLMLIYQYGTRLRFFEAVDRARELLDTDRLCLDDKADKDLADRLYCYPDPRHRAGPFERALLAAKVLGIPDDRVPDDQRDDLIQPLLARLLDAASAACDSDSARTGPSPGDLQRIESSASAVLARLSSSMTGMACLQVRDLQCQLDTAYDLLTELAEHLPVPCRLRAPKPPDVWGSLSVLVGDRLRADGVDLYQATQQATAWREVFDWLGLCVGRPSTPPRTPLCKAAALLRPRDPVSAGDEHGRSG